MATFTGTLVCVLVIVLMAAHSSAAPGHTIPVPSQLRIVYYLNEESRTELTSVYTWISGSPSLSDPIQFDVLGLNQVNVENCTSLTVKQKQTRVYKQLMLYRSPFYFAYSWEKELGGNHTDAWLRLRSTSYQLNITTELLRYRYITISQAPTNLSKVTEESLNNATRNFLRKQPNFPGIIPEAVLKGYRNFLIVQGLQDLIGYLFTCLSH